MLEDRSVVTRLGEGLGSRGFLAPLATRRTLAVLEEMGAAVRTLGAEARAVGTSALRRAEGAEAFLAEATRALGVPVEVLSGEEEARLGWRGALSDLPGLTEGDRPFVLDPGGGSTELHDGVGGQSLELGAVRLTEAFLREDPYRQDALSALTEHVRAQLRDLAPITGRPLVVVGGTATTLAALDAGLERYGSEAVHGRVLEAAAIESLCRRLAAMRLAEREALPCLQPGRADVIVAGGLLLRELLRQLGLERATVSDRGLRFGLIEEVVEGWGRAPGPVSPPRSSRTRS